MSGGTRIRTGDTMIFSSVPKPAVHLRRKPRAASRRFLEVAVRRKQPPNAVDCHAVVVELWWDAAGAGSSPEALLVLTLPRRLESCILTVFAHRCLRLTIKRLRS
jgi:hypothetical protein